MALTIKSKIALGIGILFTLLLTVSIVAIVFINLLSGKTENLLTANYNTIRYCSEMSNALNSFEKSLTAKDSFEYYLVCQEHNITEPGEMEATAKLRSYFEQLKQKGFEIEIGRKINGAIYDIYVLNQKSLELKNFKALKTASNAKLWLTCLATLLVLVGFSLAVNFPGYIANPIHLLTEGIKEIGPKNYEKRIYLETNDEFGDMADAFNLMAKRLYEYDHSNLSKIMFEKKRVETVINQMEDAVIGLDAEGRGLFINNNATNLFNLKEQDIVGKPVTEIAKYNDLFCTVTDKSKSTAPLKIIYNGKENYG